MRPTFVHLAATLLSFVTGYATPRAVASQTQIDERVQTLSTISRAQIDPTHPDYLRTHLGFYGLTPLTESSRSDLVDHYRFLWERPNRPTVLIEVEYNEAGKGSYRVMVWKGSSGLTSVWDGWPGKGQWVTEKTRSFERSGIDTFRLMIDRWNLMEEPWNDGRSGIDGSSWYLELVSRNRHHEMYRWSPETGNVRAFAVFLIEMGIDSVLVPIN